MSSRSQPDVPVTDGRDARWAEHRRLRRRQLVEAALRAIRAHGPGVGMDDIAAEAATSKTVLYRHLGDRNGVYFAVVEAVDALVLSDLERVMDETGRGPDGTPTDMVALVAAMTDGYLRLVERDPDIYRFVLTRPLVDPDSDPVRTISGRIGKQLADVLEVHLRRQQRDPAPATLWALAVVAAVSTAADHWLNDPTPPPRADVVAAVTDLFRPALTGQGASPTTTPTREER